MSSEDALQTIDMIDGKAKAVLSKNEWKTFVQYRLAYKQRRISVHQFVQHLQQLLNVPSKSTLLTEIREMILDDDLHIFDQAIFHSKQPWYAASHSEFSEWMDEGWSSLFSSTSVYRQSQNSLGFQRNDFETYLQVDAQQDSYQDKPVDAYACHLAEASEEKKRQGYKTAPVGFAYLSTPIPAHPHIITHPDQVQLGVQLHQTSPKKSFVPRTGLTVQRPALSGASIPKISGHSVLTNFGEKRDVSLIRVPKSQPTLGIAIEGGIDTPHVHPRIISIHASGAAYRTPGLSVGQSLVEVDGISLHGLCHEEVAKTISTCFQDKSRPFLTFLVHNGPQGKHRPKMRS